MTRILAALAALGLAACGADGEPVHPRAQSSVTVSNYGVGLGTTVRLGTLPVTVNWGTHL